MEASTEWHSECRVLGLNACKTKSGTRSQIATCPLLEWNGDQGLPADTTSWKGIWGYISVPLPQKIRTRQVGVRSSVGDSSFLGADEVFSRASQRYQGERI